MLILLSPSKALDFDSSLPKIPQGTQPRLLEQTLMLLPLLRQLNVVDLQELMNLSERLARLNIERFDRFSSQPKGDLTRPAALAFKGDVYTDMDTHAYGDGQWVFAQRHLRILSGLYGILRPLDAIQPYRLEMGTPLANPRGRSLYDFWGDRISSILNEDLSDIQADTVVNLASEEYFRAVHRARLRARIVQPVFKDFKSGQYKVISFFAKRARGAMANFMIQGNITKVVDLQNFTAGGYAFSLDDSTEDTLVFLRRRND